jgi:hypothetical protein
MGTSMLAPMPNRACEGLSGRTSGGFLTIVVPAIDLSSLTELAQHIAIVCIHPRGASDLLGAPVGQNV